LLSVTKVFQVLFVFVSVAFYTLLERKILGYAQIRKGAAKPRVAGLLVPFADAIKLFLKQSTRVTTSSHLYWVAAGSILTIPLFMWIWWPLPSHGLGRTCAVVVILALFRAQVFGRFGAGWGRGSKYRVVGGLRAVAQTVSYEIVFRFLFLVYIVLLGYVMHENFVVYWILLLFFVFALCCLAERMRTPFDFVEGERELVSGFNTEYRGIMFVLIFLGEYAALIFLGLISIWLWVGCHSFFTIAVGTGMAVILLVPRAVLPRLRYDQLMYLAWKSLLPGTLATLSVVAVLFGSWVFWKHY